MAGLKRLGRNIVATNDNKGGVNVSQKRIVTALMNELREQSENGNEPHQGQIVAPNISVLYEKDYGYEQDMPQAKKYRSYFVPSKYNSVNSSSVTIFDDFMQKGKSLVLYSVNDRCSRSTYQCLQNLPDSETVNIILQNMPVVIKNRHFSLCYVAYVQHDNCGVYMIFARYTRNEQTNNELLLNYIYRVYTFVQYQGNFYNIQNKTTNDSRIDNLLLNLRHLGLNDMLDLYIGSLIDRKHRTAQQQRMIERFLRTAEGNCNESKPILQNEYITVQRNIFCTTHMAIHSYALKRNCPQFFEVNSAQISKRQFNAGIYMFMKYGSISTNKPNITKMQMGDYVLYINETNDTPHIICKNIKGYGYILIRHAKTKVFQYLEDKELQNIIDIAINKTKVMKKLKGSN